MPPRTHSNPPDNLDRDATAADLQPGNVLVLLIEAHRRRDARSVRRHRQYLRQLRLDVTVGGPDPQESQPGVLGFMLDRMIAAMATGDFKLATAYRKDLLHRGVLVVPLPARAERGSR